ncbi:MAG: YceD family protein [Clostridia bacterium]|nr:YceD family protein [Clostridia bacterium]
MIIDLRKIVRSGREEESFFYEYDSPVKPDIPDGELVLPVKVSGTATITGNHSVYIECEITFTVKGCCTRCLSPTEKTFIETIREEVDKNDEESYPMVNDTVDLSQMVDDKILTTIPVSFLCDENCKGLCPTCGKNLNDGDCQCK